MNLCFDFWPPFTCLRFSTNPLSRSTLKKQSESSMFQIFSDECAVVNSCSLFIQKVIVSSEILPASPKIQHSLIA